MTTAWDDQHRRARALRRVLARLDIDQTATLAWDDDTKSAFDDPGALLQALHSTWLHRLLARADHALESGSGGAPAEVVTQAWQDTARSAPGLRRVLDTYAAAPALQHSQGTERRLLAMAAGVDTSSLSHLSGEHLGSTFLGDSRRQSSQSAQRSPCPLGRRLAHRLHRPAATLSH